MNENEFGYRIRQALDEGLARLDRGSGIPHRPATELTDTLATQDPVALAQVRPQRDQQAAQQALPQLAQLNGLWIGYANRMAQARSV